VKKVAGFRLAIMCFPIREWDNWSWGRECADQYFSVGPMRFGFSPIVIYR
jgi:hypothetical protein